MQQQRLILLFLADIWCSSAVLVDPSHAAAEDPLTELLDGCYGATCYERYIRFDDEAYSWSHRRTFQETRGALSQQVDELHLSSMKWRVASPATWHHTIMICAPPAQVGGGAEPHHFPGWATLFLNDADVEKVCDFAAATGAFGIALSNIPAQGVDIIGNHSHQADEEYNKARSWVMYADHPRHPDYVMEMALAKATSRAMDAIQDWSNSEGSPIDKFIVTGGSKRGIAAYTACAFDSSRVRAIIPEVIALRMGRAGIVPRRVARGRKEVVSGPSSLFFDELPDKKESKNIKGEVIGKEKEYKTLSPLLVEAYDSLESGRVVSADGTTNVYEDVGLPNLDTSTFRRVYSINDPYWFIEKLNCGQILIQNVGDDCWFRASSSRKYMSDLKNVAFQMHGPSGHAVFIEPHMVTMKAFVSGVMRGLELPRIKWTISLETGDVDVELANYDEANGDNYPSSVSVWRADGNLGRFQHWSETTLDLGDRATKWHVEMHEAASPVQAETAVYVLAEYDFPAGTGLKYRVTTEVSTMPNDLLLSNMESNGMIRLDGNKYEYISPNLR